MTRATIARTRFPRHAGDVLTALRIAATPVFVLLVWRAPHHVAAGWVAGGLFALVAATDVFDGRLARRAGGVSAGGRVLDHGADIFFVLAALVTYVGLGLVPWWVPAVIAASFASYAYDWWRRTGAAGHTVVVPNWMGHAGGVLNWVLIGVLVYNDSAAIQLLPRRVLAVLYALVPFYSAAAIVQRRWRGGHTAVLPRP